MVDTAVDDTGDPGSNPDVDVEPEKSRGCDTGQRSFQWFGGLNMLILLTVLGRSRRGELSPP